MTESAKISFAPDKGIKSTVIGIGTNIILAVVKGLAGIFGHSYALIADAIESIGDVFTSTVLLIGLKTAAKPPDKEHPYGHGKAEPLASLVVGAGLVLAAGVIISESIRNIITPHKVPAAFTLVVLIGVIVVKEVLFRYVLRVSTELQSHGVKADAFHHRSDAITSTAAFIGISISLIGGKGYENADDWAAIVASAIILLNAWKIAIPAIAELMDAAPTEEFINDIRQTTLGAKGVLGVEKSLVRKAGLNYYVDLHVQVDGSISVTEGHAIAHAVKNRLQ